MRNAFHPSVRTSGWDRLLANTRHRGDIAFLLLCGVVGLAAFGTELVATSAGLPDSVTGWVLGVSYHFGPFISVGLILFGVARMLASLAAAVWRTGRERRRALIGAGCAVLGAAVVVETAGLALDWRLRRIEAVTRRLTPGARAHLTSGGTHPIPVLNLNGCTQLQRADEDGQPRLWAECARGIGRWDQLFFRLDGRYSPERVVRIGDWAYLWD